MKLKLLFTTTFLLLTSVLTTASAATVEIYDSNSGKITAIEDIAIDGYGRYNVSIYNSWQGNSYDFDFASAASLALFDLYTSGVLQGSAADYAPQLFTGTEDSFQGYLATVFDSYTDNNETLLDAATFINLALSDDNWDQSNFRLGMDSSYDYNNVSYLVWEKLAEVPVPASVFLFIPALLGMLSIRRKKSLSRKLPFAY